MAIPREVESTRQPVTRDGTGDGNRTHASSLGSSRSTIELHPPVRRDAGGAIRRWLSMQSKTPDFATLRDRVGGPEKSVRSRKKSLRGFPNAC